MAHDPYQMLPTRSRLEGYAVIITGAGGAIGGATATCWRGRCQRRRSPTSTWRTRRRSPPTCRRRPAARRWHRTDVTSEAEQQALVDATLAKFGKITALINNVGWGEYTPLWDVTWTTW
jgi:7-alpha-hydroxysteroid dehydrogenase